MKFSMVEKKIEYCIIKTCWFVKYSNDGIPMRCSKEAFSTRVIFCKLFVLYPVRNWTLTSYAAFTEYSKTWSQVWAVVVDCGARLMSHVSYVGQVSTMLLTSYGFCELHKGILARPADPSFFRIWTTRRFFPAQSG